MARWAVARTLIAPQFSKASFGLDRRQHLVVELKRPKVKLTQTELAQLTNYAVAVVKDERRNDSTNSLGPTSGTSSRCADREAIVDTARHPTLQPKHPPSGMPFRLAATEP